MVGCALIKRKDLKEHTKVYPLKPVTCSLCKISLFRKSLLNHQECVCPKRKVACKCCLKGGHDEINGPEAHVKECDEYPVECPRGCEDGKQLKRKELELHLTICKLEPAKCIFSETGCKASPQRKDVAKHMESDTQAHLQSCLELQLKMDKDYNMLVTFFKDLKEKFDVLECEHDKLK